MAEGWTATDATRKQRPACTTATDMAPLLRAAALVLLLPTSGIAQSFLGYPCTVDCSGHEAGYEWAEQNGVDSAWGCGGNSNSFIEGCQAWAEEQQEEQELDGYGADGEEPEGN